MARTKKQCYLPAGFSRLVESWYQLKAFSALKAIHECWTLILQTINDILVIGLMTKAINVWEIH
jgi:hypothetical protein